MVSNLLTTWVVAFASNNPIGCPVIFYQSTRARRTLDPSSEDRHDAITLDRREDGAPRRRGDTWK